MKGLVFGLWLLVFGLWPLWPLIFVLGALYLDLVAPSLVLKTKVQSPKPRPLETLLAAMSYQSIQSRLFQSLKHFLWTESFLPVLFLED